jgi:CheY-like chemotaxis protein
MSHKKILLIDDEDDIREIAAFSFESAGGFDVETAEGGALESRRLSGRAPTSCCWT